MAASTVMRTTRSTQWFRSDLYVLVLEAMWEILIGKPSYTVPVWVIAFASYGSKNVELAAISTKLPLYVNAVSTGS